MIFSAVASAESVVFSSNHSVVMNGRVCNGSMINNKCIPPCNGVDVTGTDSDSQANDSNVCGKGASVHEHANGGGEVSLLKHAVVSGSAKISGRSKIDASEVSGGTVIAVSEIVSSEVSGNAEIQASNIVSSQVAGNAKLSGENLVSEQRVR